MNKTSLMHSAERPHKRYRDTQKLRYVQRSAEQAIEGVTTRILKHQRRGLQDRGLRTEVRAEPHAETPRGVLTCVAIARELAGFLWDIARQVKVTVGVVPRQHDGPRRPGSIKFASELILVFESLE